ncbi:phosphoketolase [Catenulispora sp. GP43]|uniref:hypothetical protein n=1 Tax=Catenulispora sp. GP43 TaxID=3156263 RepID=UPI003513A443
MLDHLEGPQEAYAYAWNRHQEMLSDVRQRLTEIEAEREQASSDQAREQLADEYFRLMVDVRARHRVWIVEHGEDLPEIREWTWS